LVRETGDCFRFAIAVALPKVDDQIATRNSNLSGITPKFEDFDHDVLGLSVFTS
jgi:hypothetical protein